MNADELHWISLVMWFVLSTRKVT